MPALEMGLTIKRNLECPTMRSVFKGELGQIGYSVSQALVVRFVDSFGFSTKLNSVQLEMLTIDAVEKFAYESLEDMILFFKYARSGRYGNTDRGVDSNLIFGKWFPLYLEEKSKALELKRETEKNNLNAIVVDPKALQKTYASIEAKKLKQKRTRYIDNLTRDMDRQVLEDTIITWEKDERMKPYVSMLKEKRRTIK